MINVILKIGFGSLGIIFLIFTLAFSSEKLSKVKCDELNVIIPEESARFIDEDEVIRLVKKADPTLFENTLDKVNTNLLEQKLRKTPAIKNVEVFRHISGERMDFKGHLVVEVIQREPLLRVVSGQDDYYMDASGVRIPANPQFTAHVMLITGRVDEDFVRQQLIPLVSFVNDDNLWKAQIKQIEVASSGELTMIPLVGEQLIEFGDANEYQEKFRNLKALYVQAFNKFGWDKYKKVSLKYKDQVVCTKR
ncbi:cell division protein FtsQ/DivIB [Mangrovibacterium sp.]|uniref:cell division protein FtsQ/DivIB n=1 Tax=Mangrovibacterium sp. TaxID=1961364 RepID=UPI003564206B